MSKRQIIILLGIWVVVFLFLGFPQVWQKLLAIATGLYLIVLAYSLSSDAPKTTDIRSPFVEHRSTLETRQVETAQPIKADISATPEAIIESTDHITQQ